MPKDTINFKEYFDGLIFRIFMFAFLGMGYDVFVTFTQQIVSGKLLRNALCPASAWMYIIYGSIPLIIYPVASFFKRLNFSYPTRLLIMLGLFYVIEYCWGSFLRAIGVEAWNYNWYLPEHLSLHGLVSWHSVILFEWLIFLMIVECIDTTFRKAYPTIKQSFITYWKELKWVPSKKNN